MADHRGHRHAGRTFQPFGFLDPDADPQVESLLREFGIRPSELPVVIVSSSGGARMMEGALSLMQMAKICGALGSTPGSVSVKTFSDGEIHLQVQENVRGADCFVVQPTCTPVDHNLMEVLLRGQPLPEHDGRARARCEHPA